MSKKKGSKKSIVKAKDRVVQSTGVKTRSQRGTQMVVDSDGEGEDSDEEMNSD